MVLDLQFLTAKDVMQLTGSSESYANQLIKDIKSEYKLKTRITKAHLLLYLNLHEVQSKDVPKNT